MKKFLLSIVLLFLSFSCIGCSNTSKSDEVINYNNVYYVSDFIQEKMDNNNLKVDLNIFNITDHTFKVSKATINFLGNDGKIIKQIDSDVNQTIDSFKNLPITLNVNTSGIDYYSINTILYDDSLIISEKVMDSEDIMSMVSNVSIDNENSLFAFDIKSDNDININYFKITALDANLNETKSLLVNKEVNLKKDETQHIILPINQKIDNGFIIYRLIEK